jgi:hypothetical protein
MFSNEIIAKNSGDTLQAISFGAQQFIICVKEEIIFAYLVDNLPKTGNFERYTDLIAEEFLDQFGDSVKNFNGDLSQFHCFKLVVDKYFL